MVGDVSRCGEEVRTTAARGTAPSESMLSRPFEIVEACLEREYRVEDICVHADLLEVPRSTHRMGRFAATAELYEAIRRPRSWHRREGSRKVTPTPGMGLGTLDPKYAGLGGVRMPIPMLDFVGPAEVDLWCPRPIGAAPNGSAAFQSASNPAAVDEFVAAVRRMRRRCVPMPSCGGCRERSSSAARLAASVARSPRGHPGNWSGRTSGRAAPPPWQASLASKRSRSVPVGCLRCRYRPALDEPEFPAWNPRNASRWHLAHEEGGVPERSRTSDPSFRNQP